MMINMLMSVRKVIYTEIVRSLNFKKKSINKSAFHNDKKISFTQMKLYIYYATILIHKQKYLTHIIGLTQRYINNK